MSIGFLPGLWALVALGPLTAAYFLRRRQRPLRVSALFLWRTPAPRAEAGPRFERYTRELSFLLEVLAVLFATAFLADLRRSGGPPVRHLVVVVDGSLSLAARPPDGPPVAERVRRAVARAAVDERATALTVVESGVRPRLLAGPRASVSTGLAALERWRPLGPAHDASEAFRLARELAGDRRRYLFFTDAPPTAASSPPPEVEWVALGTPLPNLAFVAAARRDEGRQTTVTVRVENFSSEARRVPVRFSATPDVTREETVELAPGGTAGVRATFEGVGEVSASLPEDALPEDGHLTLLPVPERPLALAVLPGSAPALSAALARFVAAAPGVSMTGAEPNSAVLRVGPPDSGAELTVGTGGNLKAFVGPFFAEKDEPLLEDVDLAGVVWAAGDSPPGHPLMTAGGVALLTREGGALRLNVDLARSSLARTEAFPVLLANLVRQSRLRQPGFPRRNLPLGAPVSVVTQVGHALSWVGPDGTRPVLGSGEVTVPAPAAPGRYRLEQEGHPLDELEVLPLDPASSDLRSRATVTRAASVSPALDDSAGERPRSSWPLWALLAVLAVDYALTGRRG